MAKIVWSPKALREFQVICDYIAEDSNEYSQLFARRVIDLVESIPTFPYSGRIVPEFQNDLIRERILMKNYRIIYRLNKERVEIVTIMHNARPLNENDFVD